MVVAKTDRAHAKLAAQFADHGRTGPLERGYLAFVWGAPDRPRGTIEQPIDRHPHARDKMAVRQGGREAITHWEVLERFAGAGRQAGGEPAGLPAGDRPHPPDPGPSGPCRPPPDRRFGLRAGIPHQSRPFEPEGRRMRSRPLEDRPCMLIYWPSNTRSQLNAWSFARNYRAISLVYVHASVPRPRLRDPGQREKGTSNQRLDASSSGSRRRDPGLSSFRPLRSCMLHLRS